MSKYKSVTNMLDDVFEDSKVSENVSDKANETLLVNELVKMRIRSGKSQKDIAGSLSWDCSKLSRFENKNDNEVKLEELRAYCNALDVGLALRIASPAHNSAEAVKSCVKQINSHLTKLTKLAESCSNDESIISGIHKFQADVLLQLMEISSNTVDSIVEQIELVKPNDIDEKNTSASKKEFIEA